MIRRILRETYGLTEECVRGVFWGAVWETASNLVVMAGMSLLFLLMGQFVDHLSGSAPLPEIGPFIVALIVFFAALLVSNWFGYTYTYGIVYGESSRQRIRLAERLRKLPLSFFGRRDLADLTETVMADVAIMEHANGHVLGQLGGAIIATAIVAVGAAIYDPLLTLAALWSVPVTLVIMYLLNRMIEPSELAVRARRVKLSESIQETLDCARELRATNHEERYLDRLRDLIDDTERHLFRRELVMGIGVGSAQIILRFGIPTVIFVGAMQITAGRIDFMVMFAFLLMVSRIYAPFDQAFMLISELFLARFAARRILDIYDEPLATGASTWEPAGFDVAFEGVSFDYGSAGSDEADAAREGGGSRQVLDGISFTAREGEVTALVGPSGSGKSTCARIAARFWDATAGRVTVGGVDISTVDPEALLRSYSVVFQDVLLFDDTVMGNIRLGRRDATDEEVRAAGRAALCEGFVNRLPNGYETLIGENGSRLSGGERQRISIARALLKDAPIVLLDEATASLDTENETLVQQALSRLLANRTVIVIAHRMRTIAGADQVVVLRDGSIVEQGAPAELLDAHGEFAHMVDLQHRSAHWSI